MPEITPQPQLEVFNPTVDHRSDQEPSFSSFPLLPTELRLTIWRHTLQCRRIIKLDLEGLRGWTGTEPLWCNDLDDHTITTSIARGERYRILLNGRQVLSKLLRVTRESRLAALTFYRAHLPCTFRSHESGSATLKSGTLYINPEYDILRLSPGMPVKDTLVNFLYHLKITYDNKWVGLLNLALDGNDLTSNDLYLLNPFELEPKLRSAFLQTFTQLRDVFFMETPRAGRQVTGILSGLLTRETWFNRSFPILAEVPKFDLLPRDPRPISKDLKRVLLSGGSDPRCTLDRWFYYLHRWGVHPPRCQYRFLLAHDPAISGKVIANRASAQSFLRREENIWNGRAPDGSFLLEKHPRWPGGAEHEDWKNEDLSKAVRPAFGFWLFPVEALGPLHTPPDQEDEHHQRKAKRIADMTGYWPELALSALY
ncbi:MAG: hypothetical protein Q9216_003946 [Gyalolechia sp. 2 TL-2023]